VDRDVDAKGKPMGPSADDEVKAAA
jgi:hypothetical protein